jgi:hypothetical protein
MNNLRYGHEPVHDYGTDDPHDMGSVDLGDTQRGWAVFNRGTPAARIERIDMLELFADDAEAVRYCIEHASIDPRCLLALCETYATDDMVRAMVDDNLLVHP